MTKYKGIYRNESPRLRGWDYSKGGHYFITINAYRHNRLFGEVVNGHMVLNDFGKIAAEEWFNSFELRNELTLDEFILMPNHLHAIVELNSPGSGMSKTAVGPLPFERKPKSISSFVACYKAAVLNKIDDLIDERQLPVQKFNRQNPLWQANYYDHIIRNLQSYARIKDYIRRNPQKWEEKYAK